MTAEIVKKRFSVTLGAPYIKNLTRLVERGIFSSEQEAIRDALRILFEKYGLEPFKPVTQKEKTP